MLCVYMLCSLVLCLQIKPRLRLIGPIKRCHKEHSDYGHQAACWYFCGMTLWLDFWIPTTALKISGLQFQLTAGKISFKAGWEFADFCGKELRGFLAMYSAASERIFLETKNIVPVTPGDMSANIPEFNTPHLSSHFTFVCKKHSRAGGRAARTEWKRSKKGKPLNFEPIFILVEQQRQQRTNESES